MNAYDQGDVEEVKGVKVILINSMERGVMYFTFTLRLSIPIGDS